MATAQTAPHAGEIKFQYGRPEVFAFKFTEPKIFEGSFGTRAMFTTVDDGYGERKIWMDYEPAHAMIDEMRRLEIRVGEPVRVTKIKHPRGGGHGYLIERPDAPAQPITPQRVPPQPAAAIASAQPPNWVTRDEASTEALLERSVDLARTHGPEVFRVGRVVPAAQPDPARSAASSALAGALMAAIDAALEATVYAARKGLNLAFSEESIRAMALTAYINAAKGGR
jgi:hypothetical protein